MREAATRTSDVPVDERGGHHRQVPRGREGSHIGSYFTKLPDPKDHPVFRVGYMY